MRLKNQRLVTKAAVVFGICALLLASVFTAPVAAAGAYPFQTTDPEVAGALDYLRAEQGTDGSIGDFATSAWVAMAVAAADEDPHDWRVGDNPSLVDYLADSAASAGAANDYARMLLAIAAAAETPSSFGGRDFVSLLESTYDGAQIGDGSLLNDDFFGVIGLIAAGEDPSSEVITDSVAFIRSNQNVDGGWSWGVGQDSDVDDTAAAIWALIAAGESASSTAITDALVYISSTQLACGGFDSWGSTNSATDSWGTCGIVAGGEDPTAAGWTSGAGNTPVDDLLTFQNVDGSFNWQSATPSNEALMTAYAIPALLGEPYPVAVLEPVPEDDGAVTVRVEGEVNTVWSGPVIVSTSTIVDDGGGEHYLAGPTALGALDEASGSDDFPYVVQDMAYGLYLYSVNGEEPSGLDGWMYRVDYVSPMVGAADFILGETTPPAPPHQEVLFYYGEWGQSPLKIEVSGTEVGVDESFTATVTWYSDDTGTWSPCESATVHADQDYTTGPDGTVDIAVATDVTISVYAEKDSFIRSNRVAVTVGTGTGDSSEVGLMAEIIPAISFTVDPGSIDFGELGPRDSSAPYAMTITNTGAWDLLMTCTVSGQADDLYAAGLELDGEVWDLFNATVARCSSREADITLTVPENYAGVGEQSGTIILWAAEAP